MPPRKKRSKATKNPPEVWVSPDLMRKLKGANEYRAGPMPHSPYLALADRFLGVAPSESTGSRSGPRATSGHALQRTREAAPAPEPPRAVAAAAGAGSGALLSSLSARILYPKPRARPAPPRPPKIALSGPPARPNPPKLQPPKPPKMSFGYRQRKVDRAK